MTNKEIAKQIDFIAKLLEFHDENPFKIRSYQNAYRAIRQNIDSLDQMSFDQLTSIKGIGKSIASDIIELNKTNKSGTLIELLEKTPEGIIDLLKIKGIGPKKIRSLWQELNITSLGELEYAIKENRLTLLKGFGEKIQENIANQIEFLNLSKGKILYFKAILLANELIEKLKKSFTLNKFEITGELRRQLPIIDKLEIITDLDKNELKNFQDTDFSYINDVFSYKTIEFCFIFSQSEEFDKNLFVSTGPEEFIERFKISNDISESEIFSSNNIPFIPPYFRDLSNKIDKLQDFDKEKYIAQNDIKGVLHNHTIWSDGADKILDMATYYKELGYEYMLISDHSQSAFYANGVKENDILKYFEDINNTNNKLEGFTVFAGIESDILSDGSLDYSENILQMFDAIIASIHSGLIMDKEKATVRLIKAIENPYTRILGHMTGRILLAREGYPVDYEKIFDACIANDVVIELNANPHRLDLDYSLISKAQDKGIKFAINPDAHSKYEVKYIDYGFVMAQKGGMLKENCINTKNIDEFKSWLQ
ncbi:MAG: helix-hairpin-helix domain-containing protein [Saprospiraceae bacterium]